MAENSSNDIIKLFTLASEHGLKEMDIKAAAKVNENVKPKYPKSKSRTLTKTFIYTVIIAVLIALQLPKKAFQDPTTYLRDTFNGYVYNPNSPCLVLNSETTIEITRKPVDCSMCEGITQVPSFNNMSKEYFLKHHAYTGIPVLVKGGAKDWTALHKFNYQYFRNLYDDKALDEFDEKECQFFGYKTNFHTLAQVFQMSKKRAALRKDQWYVGWSNCIGKVQKTLRKHYQRPSFLPDNSESSALDWIFMGGSGTGAMMHIDGVNRPSWQAMIKGSKTWIIQPPAECIMTCPNAYFNATMEQGDILVIDTNKWFHSTYIHPIGLSITIGSEYD